MPKPILLSDWAFARPSKRHVRRSKKARAIANRKKRDIEKIFGKEEDSG